MHSFSQHSEKKHRVSFAIVKQNNVSYGCRPGWLGGESVGTKNSLVTGSNPLVSPDGLVVLARDLKSGAVVICTSLY